MQYLRALTSPARTDVSNRRLGRSLAFVAGAVNAGGFFAVGQYTSHMSGIVSALADNTVLGNGELIAAGLASLLSFMAGAAMSALLINWGRRHAAQSQYAIPLVVEAMLLLCFGLLGASLERHRLLPAIVSLLCFVMGLQNAIITKISKAEIRTTHVTGIITDIGIELGKLAYWNRQEPGPNAGKVDADRPKLVLLVSLLAMFLLGGLVGAFGFQHLGFVVTVPLAAFLALLAGVPLVDGFLAHHRHQRPR